MNQYYHFATDDTVEIISKELAIKKMNDISSQWEDESTSFGKLHLGVYDWDYNKVTLELNIPKLITGGKIPINQKASSFFGFEIFGDCFLIPIPSQISKIDSLI